VYTCEENDNYNNNNNNNNNNNDLLRRAFLRAAWKFAARLFFKLTG